MIRPQEVDCMEFIRPYIEAVTAKGMPAIQLMGGIGSAALIDPGTVILTDERRYIAKPDLSLSNYRDDGNLRDCETLVLSTRDEDRVLVEELNQSLVSSRLIPEVFEVKDIAVVDELEAKPFGLRALKTFVSDRYMEADRAWPTDDVSVRRILHPFSAPINNEALEPWTLEIDSGFEVPVPSPGAVIINYLTRSISGLRGKDETKVQEMAKSIFAKAPETVDWIVDGPGSSQFELARVFHTLREPASAPARLMVGDSLEVTALGSDITEHPSFMFRDASPQLQLGVMLLAWTKSRALHKAESYPKVVTLFQKYGEGRVGTILHNK